MTDTERAWERLPKETAKAFDAFTSYLELGPERSLAKLLEVLGKPAGYTRQLETWSSQWMWVDRATAWEEHLAARRLETHEEVVLRMSERHAEDLEGLMEVMMEPVREMRRRIVQARQDGGSLRGAKRRELQGLVAGAAKVLPNLVTTERLVRGASTSAPGAPEVPQDRSQVEAYLAGHDDGFRDGATAAGMEEEKGG